MAKHRRNITLGIGPMSPDEVRRMAIRHAAQMAVETDPEMARRRAELEREIGATVKRVMSGSRPLVRPRQRR